MKNILEGRCALSKNSDHLEQSIKDLTLLLLYLTSWTENEGYGKDHRS
jgi:hypothetical protein